MNNLDSIDLKLLQIIQGNSRLTTKELASRVNLSTTPVYERVKRLENEGFIKRYVAVLDPEKLNLGLTAYVSVKLINHSFEVAQEFAAQMMKYPEVTECYNISGASDYLLKVYAKNMAGYRRFIIETIGRINVVAHIDSTFVMGEIKQTTQIPIDTESATVEEQ